MILGERHTHLIFTSQIFLGVQIQRSSGPNPMGIPHQLLRGNSQGGVGPCLDGAPASGDRSFTGGNFDVFFHPIHPSSGKLFVSPKIVEI